MATDYAEKERAFIDSLADDTGHNLDGWLAAIKGSGFTERNDIIDWLRQQGFAFAKASWIERIHHNGGRLIYGVETSPAPSLRAPIMPFSGKPPERLTRARESAVVETAESLAAVNAALVMAAGSDFEMWLRPAKGLKPLAAVVIREIERALPDVKLASAPPLVTFGGAKPFAALLPDPKELKLYGDFGTSRSERFKRTDTAGRALVGYPHMIALNDVRQIDGEFARLVMECHARAGN